MSQIETTQLDIPKDRIDFGAGQPSLSLLPLDAVAQAARHRLSQGDAALLQYGTEQGDTHFRLALADFLGEKYGAPVEPDHLFVTTGVSQGLDLFCTLFTRPGDTVFVEEPSYFLALRIFADHHLKAVGLPIDEEGLVIESLEEKLAEETPAFLYTVPTFHNPAGVTLSAARRRRLVELSQQYGFFVVADEVYHLLDYSTAPPAPLAAFVPQTETVISLSSFSKILAPGLRLGWIQAAPSLLRRFVTCGMLDSGGGLNPFTSALVRSALELGLQESHLAQLKQVYRRRSARLSAALRQHLGDEAVFTEPEGGFFIWLALPAGIDTETQLPLAHRHRVGYRPGLKFSSRQGLRNFVRLSFAYYASATLEEGARRLATAVAAMRLG